MSLEPEDKRRLSAKARRAVVIADGEPTAFWEEVAEYIDRRRAAIKDEGFHGEAEELGAQQARENELAQLVEWIEVAKTEGAKAAKELEENKEGRKDES